MEVHSLNFAPPSSAGAHALAVEGLSYSVPSSSFPFPFLRAAVDPTVVLKSISFSARSGAELFAVVGPSGAGKSTLLRAISGRIQRSAYKADSISFDGSPVRSPGRLRRLCGFVTQQDNLLPLLTVKETLMFSAKFRLKAIPHSQREERVNSLIKELGLDDIAHSYIGDEERRGISGGEKKRVSVGVDVIHNPPILLLDEPTSGLDSSSALQLIDLLSSMARKRNQIVILTIHQPGHRLLKYFSSFLLLSRGRVAHSGTLSSLESSISALGYAIPRQFNPLEFAMEIAARLEQERAPRISHLELVPTGRPPVFRKRLNPDYCSRWEEVGTLSWRFWKIMCRTKQLFLARTAQAILGGLGLGSVYPNLKASESGVAERLGFLAFTLSFLLSSTVEALPIFLQERRVVMRESSRKMYRLSSYVIANALVMMPFLLVVAILFAVPVYWIVGLNPNIHAFLYFVLAVWLIVMMASSLVLFLSAISANYVVGNYLISIFLGVYFLFSGYFIDKGSISRFWLFMYYASMYRYPLDALLINEYWSNKDKCFKWSGNAGETSLCLMNGGDVLTNRGLERDVRWLNVGIMCGFFILYRFFSWLVLRVRASRTML